jgi:hypothetical protein
MAKEGQEFVFTKEEDVEKMFFCTACNRGIVALNRGIVGRISTESLTYKAAKKQVALAIDNLCAAGTRLSKDPPVHKACRKFVKAHKSALVKAYMPRVDEDHDSFEEPLDIYTFCRIRIPACPEGVVSFDEMVGSRLLDREGADRDSQGGQKGKQGKNGGTKASNKPEVDRSVGSSSQGGRQLKSPAGREKKAASATASSARRVVLAKLRRQLMSEL